MTKQTFITKKNGDTLNASEWNTLTGYVNEIVDQVNDSSSSQTSDVVTISNDTISGQDTTAGVSIVSGITDINTQKVMQLTKKKNGVNTTIVSGNNINIEPRESTTEKKGGNISLKPGDDIELCSHHRVENNQDEVSVKVIDGNDKPVKLQLNASEITLTTKDKEGDNAAVFDINVNSAKNTKGYLKVRAQAIDLRSESHGGIALQPKGYDSDSHMNKIKFEHGGGDGLEFGTFNPEHTSLYTTDYRFNKNGVIKLATRTTLDNTSGEDGNDKYDSNDETTHYSYAKLADDFYDVIDANDPICTWEDIVSFVDWAKTYHKGPWAETDDLNL